MPNEKPGPNSGCDYASSIATTASSIGLRVSHDRCDPIQSIGRQPVKVALKIIRRRTHRQTGDELECSLSLLGVEFALAAVLLVAPRHPLPPGDFGGGIGVPLEAI